MEWLAEFDHISELVELGIIDTLFKLIYFRLCYGIFFNHLLNFFCAIYIGHSYVVIVDEDKDEGMNYYLCCCVEAKK